MDTDYPSLKSLPRHLSCLAYPGVPNENESKIVVLYFELTDTQINASIPENIFLNFGKPSELELLDLETKYKDYTQGADL